MSAKRSYDGPALDGTVQYITERPYRGGRADDGKTEYATEPADGEITTEGVPVPEPDADEQPPRAGADERSETPGQTTLGQWGEQS